jgi:hypothetical protein
MSELFVERFRSLLPCDTGAARRVRAELDRIEEIESVRAEALLVASELVSNAVLNSGCGSEHDIEVRARLSSDRFEISVHHPMVPHQAKGRETGDDPSFGLTIVDELAHTWGTSGIDGRIVWAQITLTGATPVSG